MPRRNGGRGEDACSRGKIIRDTSQTPKRFAHGFDHRVPQRGDGDLVWAFGLILFYASRDDDLGEELVYPNSVFVLFAFCVMLSGAYIYYTRT